MDKHRNRLPGISERGAASDIFNLWRDNVYITGPYEWRHNLSIGDDMKSTTVLKTGSECSLSVMSTERSWDPWWSARRITCAPLNTGTGRGLDVTPHVRSKTRKHHLYFYWVTEKHQHRHEASEENRIDDPWQHFVTWTWSFWTSLQQEAFLPIIACHVLSLAAWPETYRYRLAH